MADDSVWDQAELVALSDWHEWRHNDVAFLQYCGSTTTSLYPLNMLATSGCHKQILENYYKQLQSNADTRLTSAPLDGVLTLFTSAVNPDRLGGSRMTTLGEMAKVLGVARKVPSDISALTRTQFFFFNADDTLGPLDVSLDMLCLLLTFLQVMPRFLDYLFVFGPGFTKRENSTSGLWYELPIGSDLSFVYKYKAPLELKGLGRSVNQLQLSYLLRAVEQIEDKDDKWGYRVRPQVVFHSLDFGTCHSRWIIVAPNRRTQHTITENAIDRRNRSTIPSYAITTHLQEQLDYHLMLVEKSSSQWGLFVNKLDVLFERVRSTLFKTTTIESFENQETVMLNSSALSGELDQDNVEGVQSNGLQRVEETEELTPSFRKKRSTVNRQLQPIEDKLLEAREGLLQNVDTLSEMYAVFFRLVNHMDFPNEHRGQSLAVYSAFEAELQKHIARFKGEIQKIDTLLAMIKSSRETLAADLQSQLAALQQAHRELSRQRYQQEQDRLETIHRQAQEKVDGERRAKEEMDSLLSQSIHTMTMQSTNEASTVRVITIVALLFLPATFVANFMNAGIIHYNDGANSIYAESVTAGALKLFFAITVPLTALVFLASAFFILASRPGVHRRAGGKVNPVMGLLKLQVEAGKRHS